MIKKIGKKKIIIIFLCLLLILAGIAIFFLYQKQSADNEEEEIVLKQGQSLVYGQIASIYGNEITYYVMEEQEETQMPSERGAEAAQMLSENKGEGIRQEGAGESGGQRSQIQSQGDSEKNTRITEETVTVQIPVGTQVTTRLGTVTTFSRLAAGDNIKMLVQEEDGEQVILEIWIVE